jgi:hypothetical protein
MMPAGEADLREGIDDSQLWVPNIYRCNELAAKCQEILFLEQLFKEKLASSEMLGNFTSLHPSLSSSIPHSHPPSFTLILHPSLSSFFLLPRHGYG